MAQEQQSGGLPERDLPDRAAAGPGLRPNGQAAAPVRRISRRRTAGPAREQLAANDDAPSIGGLIFALQQRPSDKPFLIAAIGSGVWALVGLLLGWALLSDAYLQSGSLADLLVKPATAAIIATIVIPIALFWFLALLSWRAESLRLVSSAMTEVAVRLAEPDRMAEQSVASLGQSVRRQVAALNDGISRALGRAGELEALVHNEVAALERTYSENELRIRSLIDELASERDALANNSERVSDSLRSIGHQITQDIAVAGEHAARQLGQASAVVANQLSDKGNALFSALTVMNQRIGSEVPTLLEKLGSEQTRLTRIVETAGKNLAALEVVLSQRTDALEGSLAERTGQIQAVISQATDQLHTVLAQGAQQLEGGFAENTGRIEAALDNYGQSVDHTIRRFEDGIGERFEGIEGAIIERTRAIDNAFALRLQQIDARIAEGAAAIDGAIAERAMTLRSAMQAHATALGDLLDRQAGNLDQTLVQGIQQVRRASETIANQSMQTINGLSIQAKMLKEISEGLMDQVQGLTGRYENQTQLALKASQGADRYTPGPGEPRGYSAHSEVVSAARESSEVMRRTLGDQMKALDAISALARGNAAMAGEITPPEGSSMARQDGRGADDPLWPGRSGSQSGGAPSPRPRAGNPPGSGAAMADPGMPIRESWSLGDLLARASQEDEEAPRGEPMLPALAPKSSNLPLSLDQMARVLDAATAANVWHRYRSGDRSVFSRQLYSRDGQVTFDEISRRYGSDPGFKTMAERYISDFERLLREAEQKDTSGRLVQNHLVAETGRVYLLLAHASGRLG